jgi:hypothetical protein
MLNEIVKMLSSSIMMFATLDILYKSQVKFKDRLQAEDVKTSCMKIVELHQVKDMNQFTETCRAMRRYITQKLIDL